MEHAPLRPVPARPAGPIDPDTALRELEAWLPTLEPETASALALVVLAERPRGEVAATLGVAEPELGILLASARKELRQTLVVLGGSGWCERAEGLISDRLDGPLHGRDARRLDVHLRNCSRCVEHERRLVQATDALIASAGGFARSPAPADAAPVAEAATLVEAAPVEEAAPLVEAAPPNDGSEDMLPAEADELAVAEGEEPGVAGREERDVAGGEERAATRAEEVAAAAEVLVVRRTRGQIATAVAWNSLVALAILLALATLAVTIAGILGAQL